MWHPTDGCIFRHPALCDRHSQLNKLSEERNNCDKLEVIYYRYTVRYYNIYVIYYSISVIYYI